MVVDVDTLDDISYVWILQIDSDELVHKLRDGLETFILDGKIIPNIIKGLDHNLLLLFFILAIPFDLVPIDP